MQQIISQTNCIVNPAQESMMITDFDRMLNRAKNVFMKVAHDHFAGYVVDGENRETIVKCLVYLLGGNEQFPDLDPQKGLMLVGNIGCGKSMLMEILKSMMSYKTLLGIKGKGFRIVKAADISDEYMLGSKGEQYGELFYNGKIKSFALCIDDLGFESIKIMIYGNEIIPLAHVLNKRCAVFEWHGDVTHITTNLSPGEIEAIYGDRIRDRLRKMCNVVPMGGESRR